MFLVVLIATSGSLSVGISPATAKSGAFGRYQYGKVGTPGARAYWKYVPAGLGTRAAPLVVHLHGCQMTAAQAATQSRFNRMADRGRFIVIYPDQNVTPNQSYPFSDGNGLGCWNWFHPDQQVRGKNEPAAIAGIVAATRKAHRIDAKRIYVSGVSAGADMAVILGVTYPDVFAAVGALAGCAYATCADRSGQLAYAAMGARKRIVPLMVMQGTADQLNNVAMGESLVSSWLATADLVDDGTPNASVPKTPDRVVYGGVTTPSPGTGDACVRARSFTCPGGAAGFQRTYPWTATQYLDANRCQILDLWIVHGGTHAYYGGDPSVPFTDPLGPDATGLLWSFFEAHPRGRCTTPLVA